MPTKPTRAKIVKFLGLEAEAKKLGTRAYLLRRLKKPIGEELLAYVLAIAKKTGRVEICGHALEAKEEEIDVDWKTAYIKLAGEKKALQLCAKRKKKKVLVVSPLATKKS